MALQYVMQGEMRETAAREERGFRTSLASVLFGTKMEPEEALKIIRGETEEEIDEDGNVIPEVGDDDTGYTAEDIDYMTEQSNVIMNALASQGVILEDV